MEKKTDGKPKSGKRKALVYHADTENPGDLQFAKEIEEVSATNPTSLTEFLVSLSALHVIREVKVDEK